MALDLRTSPYYDDFNPDKNFHRILFKPGYAVQARELTQIQTVLQDQLQRFGNHIFKDGSVVLGCAETFKFNVPFVKISNFNNLNILISDELFESFKTSLLGKVISNELGVKAEIIHVDVSPSGQRVLYLNYIQASNAVGQEGLPTFSNVDETLSVEGLAVKFRSIINGIGEGSLFTLGDGIVYAKGYFIRNEEITKVVDHFTTTPSKKVGFRVYEDYVTSDDDVTLLDPAAGSYNYAAPGADRYRLTTDIIVYDIDQTVDTDFYLLFEVSEGKVKRAYNKPQYSELQKVLAQRTFDESGNYAVRGLNVLIREHLKTDTNNGKYTTAEGGDLSKLVYGVEPGKAYVEGYDIELGSTEYLSVEKALDTEFVDEKAISTTFGNYVLVSLVKGNWDITKNPVALLKAGSTTVTTCRVRLVEWDSSATYRLYLYDVDTQLNLSTVTSIESLDGNHIANIVGVFSLKNSQFNSMLFPTGFRAIESYQDDTDYYFWKEIGSIDIVNTGPGTFVGQSNLSLGEVWAYNTLGEVVSPFKQENFLVTVQSTGANITSAITINIESDTSIRLNYTSSVSVKLLAKVRVTDSDPINKTVHRTYLKISDTATFTGDSLTNWVTHKRLYLGISDAIDIEKIYYNSNTTVAFGAAESEYQSWTDLTDSFELHTNQNDNYYNTSYIEYLGNTAIQGRFLIKFRYFKRDTYSAGYMNKNSYQGILIDADPMNPLTTTDLAIYTYQIPVYTSSVTGLTYDLRDVFDFRPAILNRETFENKPILTAAVVGVNENIPVTTMQAGITVPSPNNQLVTSFNYYLPRNDKVIVTRDGVFGIIKGDAIQQTPHMVLAQIRLAPYPSLSTFVGKEVGREDYSSSVRLVDNRRYTMRDIGDIDQRVSRLEYFASLSMIESKAANIPLFDNTGDLMVKRGILVDAFDGHSVGNVFDKDYSIAIDTQNKMLRPTFEIENVEFELVTGNKIGDLIVSNKIDDEVLMQNTFLSKSRTCGSAILTNYQNGILRLNPQQDTWFDESTRPDVQSNYQNNNDGWEFSTKPFKLHWKSWNYLWKGTEYNSTYNDVITTVNGISGVRVFNETARFVSDITKSMVITQQLPETNVRVSNDRLFDISIIPFIRPQIISFVAKGLKPYSLVKAYFDDEEVTENCRYFTLPTGVSIEDVETLNNPILLSQYEGSASEYNPAGGLLVGEDGTVVGQFKIDTGRFRSGNRIFRLSDTAESTMATAQFQASGVPNFNDSVITSTRLSEVRQDSLSSTQNTIIGRITLSNPTTWNPNSYGDPMAQTFIVEGETDGVMLTKVDVFFNTISTTKGIAVQIREVVNGFPGNRIVPFSTKFLAAGDATIKSSSTGTEATTFVFDSPVYLKNNVEYALVILPENNTTEYSVWVSELGQNKLGTSERITQQPYVGVLFIPNNNTSWSALENEDLKFTLYKGVFTASQNMTFKSAPVDYIKVSKTGSHELQPGDVVKVYSGEFEDLTPAEIGEIVEVTVSGKIVTGSNTAFNNGELLPGDLLRIDVTGQEITGNTTSPTVVLTNNSDQVLSNTSIFQNFKVGDILYKNDIDKTVIGKIKSITNNQTVVLEEAYLGASESSVIFNVYAVLGQIADITSSTSLTLKDNYRGVLGSGHTAFKDITTGEGFVSHIKDDVIHVYVNEGNFAVGDKFDISETRFEIDEFVNPVITGLFTNFGALLFSPITDIVWKYRLKNSLGVQTNLLTMKNGDTVEFETPYILHSYSSTYGEAVDGKPAIEINATFSSQNTNMTAIVDNQKMLGLVFTNNISSSDSASVATYVTRTVTLDVNSDDPDDLRVFLDMKKPENSMIKVYAKLNDDNWTLMTETTPLVLNSKEFQEYVYQLPIQKIYNKFSIKIEMYSGTSTLNNNPCKIPLIKNFRTIALL
jgi:hypothetical protein